MIPSYLIMIRGIVIIWKDMAIANCSEATLGCSNRLYSDFFFIQIKENTNLFFFININHLKINNQYIFYIYNIIFYIYSIFRKLRA
jgi:hypothetical protein